MLASPGQRLMEKMQPVRGDTGARHREPAEVRHGGRALHPSHLSSFSVLQITVAAGRPFVTGCVTLVPPWAAQAGGTVARRSGGQARGFAQGFAGGASSARHSPASRSRSAARLRSEIYGQLMEKWVEWEDTSSPSLGGARGGTSPGCLVLPSFHFCAPQRRRGPPHPLGHLGGCAGWGNVPVPSIALAWQATRARCPLRRDVQVVSPPSSSPAGTHGTTSSNNCFITG